MAEANVHLDDVSQSSFFCNMHFKHDVFVSVCAFDVYAYLHVNVCLCGQMANLTVASVSL